MSNNTAPSNQPEQVEEDMIEIQFRNLEKTLSTFRSQIAAMNTQIKAAEKNVKKEMRALRRLADKSKSRGNRKPSGFATPTKISDDLCKFMNKPKQSEAARTEVTKYIISYIKENKLQSPENKKIIKPDNALKSLLKPKKKDEITFFNIQRYMNKHFLKSQ